MKRKWLVGILISLLPLIALAEEASAVFIEDYRDSKTHDVSHSSKMKTEMGSTSRINHPMTTQAVTQEEKKEWLTFINHLHACVPKSFVLKQLNSQIAATYGHVVMNTIGGWMNERCFLTITLNAKKVVPPFVETKAADEPSGQKCMLTRVTLNLLVEKYRKLLNDEASSHDEELSHAMANECSPYWMVNGVEVVPPHPATG